MAYPQFAIKDAIDLTLTSTSDASKVIVIDYLNDIQIQMETEQVYATKKGVNAIAFSGSRTGTLTMNAEVIDIDFLALMLGATVTTDGKITVTDDVPQHSFTATGTFNVQGANGTNQVVNIQFYKLQVQVSADLSLSASEVSGFTLVLDILADPSGKIMEMTAPSGLMSGASVSEPKIIDFDEE